MAKNTHPDQKANTKNQPAAYAATVTPSDSTDLAFVTKWLWVGTTGNVSVLMAGDDAVVTFNSVPAGTKLEIQCYRVRSTGTSASNIVACY
jgi:hypothetical protein